jgi:hypothetical protein
MGIDLPNVSLHDAEVLTATLSHDGPTVELVVEAFARTEDARRFKMTFVGVSEMELRDLHTQNVLFDLDVVRASDGSLVVTLDPSVGLTGSLRCTSIESTPFD